MATGRINQITSFFNMFVRVTAFRRADAQQKRPLADSHGYVIFFALRERQVSLSLAMGN